MDPLRHDTFSGSEYVEFRGLRAQGCTLSVDLKLSRGLKKYFFKSNLTVEYDCAIDTVDESILIIPALSLVGPISCATGANVYVEKVDEDFMKSLLTISKLFRQWYPQFSSEAQISVDKIVKNNPQNGNKKALLFSAGLDSFASYNDMKLEHPDLITLIKTDGRYRYFEKVKAALKHFAEDESVPIHFIRSDLWDARSDIVDNRSLEIDFEMRGWWEQVSHGLITLGLCAPLTTVEKISQLRLSSTFQNAVERPDGSHFLKNTPISWAGIKIIFDTLETRQGKIRHYFRGIQPYYKYLRVCVDPSHYIVPQAEWYPKNCGHCDKCLRTIIGLILEGVDPNECNFAVGDDILEQVKAAFSRGTIDKHGDYALWIDIQKYISDYGIIHGNETFIQYSGQEFLKWLQLFDFSRYKPNTYNRIQSEFVFSLHHRGLHATLSQTRGYITTIARKKLRKLRK